MFHVQVCKDLGINTVQETCTASGFVVIKSATTASQAAVDAGILNDRVYNVHLASPVLAGRSS